MPVAGGLHIDLIKKKKKETGLMMQSFRAQMDSEVCKAEERVVVW